MGTQWVASLASQSVGKKVFLWADLRVYRWAACLEILMAEPKAA